MSSAATATATAAAARNKNKNKNRNRNRPPEDRGPQTRNNNINAIAVTPQSKPKHKPKPKHKAAFLRKRSTSTPRTSLDRRMSVNKEIVDELLLVCGVIGTTTTTASTSASKSNSSTDSHDSNDQPSLIPVTDCLNWLQDLQRALRRDDDLYRPISLLLGQWKIVEQKLLPLVVSCKYDTPLVVTVLKILVILTKPLAENTQRAGQMVIDVNHKNKNNSNNSSNNSDRDDKAKRAVVEQQIRLRENALAQAEQRMDYKRLVAYWSAGKSSGTRSTSSNKDKPGGSNNKNGILSVFVSLLAEPLSKSGASRTDADHLTIELVLHLIRNLLSAQPLLNTSPETSRMAARLHQDMIVLLEKELVLEILLVIGQDLELRENAQYNLLVMEILHNLIRAQDPTAVAKSLFVGNTAGGTCGGSSRSGKPPPSSSVLASMRLQEKAQRKTLRGVRHGHFSGTWVRKQADGTKRFVSAVEAVNGNNSSIGSSSSSSSSSHGPSRSGSRSSGSSSHSLRSGRQSEPFIGSGRTLKVHTKNPMGAMTHSSGPSAVRAHKTLHKFCERFVADCYGPFAKSLKNEFRRDSQRLEERDKMVFFRLVWFFAQWSRARKTKKTATDNSGIGKLIITMDVFTFHLVLNAAETYHQQKKPTKLASAVAVYSEMIHLLYRMYHNQDDPTEHDMAIGLIDRLFYHGQDALDPLPKLLARWTPGTSTREYLCDLVEIAHVSLKLLEANTKEGIEFVRSKPSNGNGSAASGLVSQKIAKMKTYASTFDVQQYFAKNIVSNRLVTMYTYLMDQYKVNAAVVNHRIVTMFRRLMRFEIATPEVVDDETDDRAAANPNPLGIQRTTLEPMLYNLQVIVVMERILNDSVIRSDASYEPLVQLCTGLMHGFWCAAESNPMLYVECLFQNAGYTPHRFCEAVTNKYVTEELRMMAEREQLAEEQERLVSDETGGAATATATANRDDDDDDDDDDEAEHEFTGDAVVSPGETAGAETDILVITEQEPTSQESPGAEASSVEAETSGEDSSVVSKKQTKKRGLEDDSSDDEAIFGSTTEETQPIAKRRKHVLDDDDDDDSDDDDDDDSDDDDNDDKDDDRSKSS